MSFSGSSSNPYMFAATSGYRNDGDAGLSHVGARYYDAQVGRFITRDTYLDQHPYLYCEHDPVNAVDPSGHEWCTWLPGGPPSTNTLIPEIPEHIKQRYGPPIMKLIVGAVIGAAVAITFPALPAIGVGIISGGITGGLWKAWDPDPNERTPVKIGIGIGEGSITGGLFRGGKALVQAKIAKPD